MRECIDIDTARGDIGGDQDSNRAKFKIIQRFCTCGLTFITVDRGGSNTDLLKILGEFVGSVFGAGKDENLFPFIFADELSQKGTFTFAID